ncbi:Unknown protein sequence [Pseudomonas coronafaciens pv. oryzae]|nr:Unknown protein sequence [Pseudomonas coronafaciens pv. oryzae]
MCTVCARGAISSWCPARASRTTLAARAPFAGLGSAAASASGPSSTTIAAFAAFAAGVRMPFNRRIIGS